MNNFYASVECMFDSVLKKYPVAVCDSVEERHGIVLAKNYAAKAFGIKTGDAVWQAKQKCRNLVVVPPHFEEYIKYSNLQEMSTSATRIKLSRMELMSAGLTSAEPTTPLVPPKRWQMT